ncbi:hypothetical protein [Leptolyngbya sp. FACHB-16]|uniref:hypothetical protein n=1 Tax=unclassified Leptolyngbya TaxID=2650499 RepID=UPI0016821DDD|nr:hypothetical protein [Leptolyngbya sp. FACHB-16]MBD2153098.1 hypothetical protein [Leptolyngbya sp. FACHB-16]
MSKTLEANAIPIGPHLAGLLKRALGKGGTGIDEAAFLQQLHYWTSNSQVAGWLVDGVKWVYNSLHSWLVQLPWMSEYGLRKAIANLKKLGLLQTAQHGLSQYNRVMFYRIDYERLNGFVGGVCEQDASRRVESDRVDVRSDHTSYTETSSDTSFPEQQTAVVVPCMKQDWDEGDRPPIFLGEQEQSQDKGDRSPILLEEPSDGGEDPSSAPSSGKDANNETANFPELMNAVAQAVGLDASALPRNLRRAIAQHPGRIRGAIAYLQHHQQKRKIENPVGYLYEAIVYEWTLPVSQSLSIVPHGFNEWFNRARAEGLVVAAMAIDGVHHTLHTQKGWVPTMQLIHNKL